MIIHKLFFAVMTLYSLICDVEMSFSLTKQTKEIYRVNEKDWRVINMKINYSLTHQTLEDDYSHYSWWIHRWRLPSIHLL